MSVSSNPSSTKTLAAGAVFLLVGLGAGWALSQWLSGGGRAAAPATAAATAASAPERRVLYWYDPMVPTQRFDKPGKSPFMEMQLVPRYDSTGARRGVAPLAGDTLVVEPGGAFTVEPKEPAA